MLAGGIDETKTHERSDSMPAPKVTAADDGLMAILQKKVKELTNRVKALEYKMARSTGMQCSRCAQFSLREIDRKETAKGPKVIFHCGKCNKNETMGA